MALATNRASFTVSFMPWGLDAATREQVLTRLSELLGLTRPELDEAIAKGSRYSYEPIRVMQDVSPQTVVALEELRFELPGVMVEMEEVREYPSGSWGVTSWDIWLPLARNCLMLGPKRGTMGPIMLDSQG